jgi:hypothetical protein
MGRTHYAVGRSAEYAVKKRLLKLGAVEVARSAGSHGHADLIAFFPASRQIWLIQVKTSKKGVSFSKVKDDFVALTKLEGTWVVKAGYFIKTREGWRSNYPF